MEFKKYLRGVGDAGTRLLFNSGQERMDSMKSWAGIEEGKAGRSVCCVMQSVKSVSHVLWDCPAYASNRSAFCNVCGGSRGQRFTLLAADIHDSSTQSVHTHTWPITCL